MWRLIDRKARAAELSPQRLRSRPETHRFLVAVILRRHSRQELERVHKPQLVAGLSRQRERLMSKRLSFMGVVALAMAEFKPEPRDPAKDPRQLARAGQRCAVIRLAATGHRGLIELEGIREPSLGQRQEAAERHAEESGVMVPKLFCDGDRVFRQAPGFVGVGLEESEEGKNRQCGRFKRAETSRPKRASQRQTLLEVRAHRLGATQQPRQ